MQQFKWIDLPLWDAIKAATADPEDANLTSLWQEVDAAILNLDCLGGLQVAGEAIAKITDVFELRSQLAFESIQAIGSDDGPVMSEDSFDRYVRQTMQIDFETYIEPLADLPRKVAQPQEPDKMQSLVAEVDRQVLLEAILSEPNDSETVYQQVLELAHDENVSKWGAKISAHLDGWDKPVSLMELHHSIEMPLIQIWLALLLNEIPLEQRGDFYQTEQVWILR